jgi:Zn-dependent peptidase ImmA (M78 family)
MRWVPDPTGRFAHRPFYEEDELENRCTEAIQWFYAEKLHRAFTPPMTDHDLQSLVEAHVDDLDLYADLSMEGTGVEAVTEFRPDRGPCVRIAQQLSRDKRRRKRLRTGLSHELGHVLFHADLFTNKWRDEQGAAGPALATLQRAVCKRETLAFRPRQPDWAEWQAGYSCGAILMPKTHVLQYVSYARETGALPGTGATEEHVHRLIVWKMAQQFDVSTEAARVRLEVLGIRL